MGGILGGPPQGYGPAEEGPGQGCNLPMMGLASLILVASAILLAVLVHHHNQPQGGTGECGLQPLPALWAYAPNGPEMQVKILSYNLFWWQLFGVQKTAGGAPFKLIAHSDQPMPYDIMAFQECEDGPTVLRGANLLDQYTLYSGMGTKTTAICMAFLTRQWDHLSHGSIIVGEDAPGQFFGQRAVQWMRLRHRAQGRTIFFANHHGPTPINSGGKCGGAAIANRLLSVIHTNAVAGDAVVLVGDFNALEASPTVQGLLQQLQRVFSGTCDGGIDHIFANPGATRVVAERNLGGGGSEHDALAIILGL